MLSTVFFLLDHEAYITYTETQTHSKQGGNKYVVVCSKPTQPYLFVKGYRALLQRALLRSGSPESRGTLQSPPNPAEMHRGYRMPTV